MSGIQAIRRITSLPMPKITVGVIPISFWKKHIASDKVIKYMEHEREIIIAGVISNDEIENASNDIRFLTGIDNYKIDKEDYNLYKNNPQAFYKKYENEIKQNNNAYTENFIGSSALRDYDGVKDFQHSYPTKNEIINPFQNYVYIEGILFARIIWEIGEFLIPPFQKIISKDGSYKFPLREICELKNNSSGNPICYYLSFDD